MSAVAPKPDHADGYVSDRVFNGVRHREAEAAMRALARARKARDARKRVDQTA